MNNEEIITDVTDVTTTTENLNSDETTIDAEQPEATDKPKSAIEKVEAKPTIEQLKLDNLTRTIEAFALLGDEKAVAQANALGEIENFALQYKSAKMENSKLMLASLCLGISPNEVGKSKLKPELFTDAIKHFVLPDSLYPDKKNRADEIKKIKDAVFVQPSTGNGKASLEPTRAEVGLTTALMRDGEQMKSIDLTDEKQVNQMQSFVMSLFYAACMHYNIPEKLTRFLMVLTAFCKDGDTVFTATNQELAEYSKTHTKTIERSRSALLEYMDETQNAIVDMEEIRKDGKLSGTRYTVNLLRFLTSTFTLVNDAGYIGALNELTEKQQEQRKLDADYKKRLDAAKETGDSEKVKKVEAEKPKNALERMPATVRPLAEDILYKIEEAKSEISTPTTTTNDRIKAVRLEALKESARRVKAQLATIETPEATEAITEIDRFLLEGTNFDKDTLAQYQQFITDYQAKEEAKRQAETVRLRKQASTATKFDLALRGYRKLAERQVGTEADESADVGLLNEQLDQTFQSVLLDVSIMRELCGVIGEALLETPNPEEAKAFAGSAYYKERLIELVEFAFREV